MDIKIPDSYFTEEELENTPKRVNKFFGELKARHNFEFKTFDNPGYDDLVILKDIGFSSFCSHHLLPFHGKAHVGYLPAERICGISKLARLVDKWAARPQLQERMTSQIADELMEVMNPLGCMVVIEAQHECMITRGILKPDSTMVTSTIRGQFKSDPSLKSEFLKLCRTNK